MPSMNGYRFIGLEQVRTEYIHYCRFYMATYCMSLQLSLPGAICRDLPCQDDFFPPAIIEVVCAVLCGFFPISLEPLGSFT